MKIYTDTATLVIYDLDQLNHRLNADQEWWIDPEEELKEINQGHVLFIGLDYEGSYDVDMQNGKTIPKEAISANLLNSSGRFYIGPAEKVTSAGQQPIDADEGFFYEVKPGSYQIQVAPGEEDQILIWVKPLEAFNDNQFVDSPFLEMQHEFIDVELIDEDIEEVIDDVTDHLVGLGYELIVDENSDDDVTFYHEELGYLFIQEYEGGLRFYTMIEYDPDKDLHRMTLEEFGYKLLQVVNHFNATSAVARAYDDPEGDQIVIECWYPASYSESSFSTFIELWQDDVTVQFEGADKDVFGERQTH